MTTIEAVIQRKDPRLPRYVEVPAAAIASWRLSETTTVDATLNGVAIGRRSLKPWDDARWFVEIPETACRAAGVDTGDRVRMQLALADTALPAELAALIEKDAAARKAWEGLTSAQQRMLREEVAGAKTSATRERRARRGLGVG